MDKLYLEIPSIERKSEITHYLNEFGKYKSDINGLEGLYKIYEGYTFEQALDRNLNMQNEEYAKSLNRCCSKTFLLIRKNDNKIVGNIAIRWNLTEDMQGFASNIGYSIRPTERKKGYSKINLYLGLLETKKLGLNRIVLDCDANNIASEKTMLALGGVLTGTAIDPFDGILTKVYLFDVNECINKNKDIYEPMIEINYK